MLRFTHVKKHFGGIPAIEDFSLTVERHQFCGLIGPNGAGKTTLMNLVCGYLRPDAGQISFQGANLVGLRPYQICRRGLGRTFQVVKPFLELSVRDNVVTGALFSRGGFGSLRAATARAEEVLALVGLHDKRDVAARTLTLGEKKRLELARSLATQPEFLMLDEVMGGLSDGEITQLVGVLARVHQAGTTVLMIEHVLPAMLQLIDRLVVLNFGRMAGDGVPREVLASPAVIESYLGKPLE